MGGRGVSSFLSQINSKFSVTTNPCLTIYPLMGRMLNYYLLSSFFFPGQKQWKLNFLLLRL